MDSAVRRTKHFPRSLAGRTVTAVAAAGVGLVTAHGMQWTPAQRPLE